MNRETDALTPLDARNTLLLNPTTLLNTTANSHTRSASSVYSNDPKYPFSPRQDTSLLREKSGFDEQTRYVDNANPYDGGRQQYPSQPQHRQLGSVGSQTNLVAGAAPIGGRQSPPNIGRPAQYQYAGQNRGYGGNGGYRGMAY